MERRIGMLFDCLRAPYDVAHIIQVASAIGNYDLYLTGNSIDTKNRKIITKVKSWGIKNIPEFQHIGSFEEGITYLRSNGRYLVGTTINSRNSIYKTDFTKNDSVIVFGTESSGLTQKKQTLLDELVTVPTSLDCKFLTLPVVVPIVAFEYFRQLRRLNNEDS